MVNSSPLLAAQHVRAVQRASPAHQLVQHQSLARKAGILSPQRLHAPGAQLDRTVLKETKARCQCLTICTMLWLEHPSKALYHLAMDSLTDRLHR